MEKASYGAAMRTTSPVKPLTVEDREMRAATLCDRVEDAPAGEAAVTLGLGGSPNGIRR